MPELALTALSDPIEVPVEGGTVVAEATGTGTPVLLLHAGVCDRRSWRPLAPFLPDHRLIAPDRRGYGDTRSTARMFDHVTDTVAVLDHLGVDRAVVVGNSMGGAVAQHLALEHPDRVAGLVLIAAAWPGGPYPADPPEFDQVVEALEAADEAGDLDEVNRIEARFWLDGPFEEEGRVGDPARQLFLEMNGRALQLDVSATGEEVERGPTWERLDSVAVPVALVVGDLDEPAAEHLCRAAMDVLDDATLHVLEGVAHVPGLERPDALAEIVRDVTSRAG